MDNAKQQLIDKLKSANNVLVTVSRNPSVDQLAACIGMSLLLNKQGKHAAAVFSGQVPSTLEFLQPGETLEKNTDSLRDFIISLDRSKADKLRYKVEDNVVRIFITPYKTSISQEDLEFSEGDFNVDLVIALGVQRQEDLDEAITAHGRILHDATVATITLAPDGELGVINWVDPQASSLSELVAELVQTLGADLLDNQIATALLTGVVAETERFSNDKTSPQTMSVSAALMAAGANQQLVASKLEEPETGSVSVGQDGKEPTDGSAFKIDHDNDEEPSEPIAVSDKDEPLPPPPVEPESLPNGQPGGVSPGPKFVTEPPTLGGTLTANTSEEKLDPAIDPMSLPAAEPPLLDRQDGAAPPDTPTTQPPAGPSDPGLIPPPKPTNPDEIAKRDDMTLTDIEAAVDSPHLKAEQTESLSEAREEISRAISGTPEAGPIQGLNAQPLGGELHPPGGITLPGAAGPVPAGPANGQGAPPPVPPPIITPQIGNITPDNQPPPPAP